MRAKAAVILLSGGMDSSTLLHDLRRRRPRAALHALTLRYGQKHVRELQCAVRQARAANVQAHEVLDVDCLGQMTAPGTVLTGTAKVPALRHIPRARRDQPPTYVPNRNLTFLALAAAYAEAHGVGEVFYAAQRQDFYGYWDCTPAFVRRLNRVLALNRRTPVIVRAPFVKHDKVDILAMGMQLGVAYEHTWSCYRGGRRACGVCPACVERRSAFARLGADDPLPYA